MQSKIADIADKRGDLRVKLADVSLMVDVHSKAIDLYIPIKILFSIQKCIKENMLKFAILQISKWDTSFISRRNQIYDQAEKITEWKWFNSQTS